MAFTKNIQSFNVSEFFTDPPVKISGSADAVSLAADRIRAELDPLDNPNRVSLKMEVSWTEHSHIIGREGRSIKSVSTVTQCHIHFPDSNRFSETEKCNQVSIAGDPQAVETARAQVRNLSPVIFAFEIPFATEIQSILESRQSPQMQYIQNAYNVQIIVRNKGRPGTVALVKGNSWELEKVKTATRALMQHLCQGETEAMMYLEISPHYHSSVLGSNGASHVRAIMAVTGTMIVWPNLADTSLHPLRKATFVISGQIDKVYAAREMLIGSLPLVLMADLPQGLELEMEQVQHVMTVLKVTVSTRPKNKNGVLHRTLVIRGTERNVDRLYEARRILLGLPPEARVICHVPDAYYVPPVPPSVPLQQTMPLHSMPLLPMPGSAGAPNCNPNSNSGGYTRYSPDAAGSLLGWYQTPATPTAGQYAAYPYPFLTPTDNAKLFASMSSWMYPDRRASSATPRLFGAHSHSHGSNASSDWNGYGNEKLNASFLGNSTGSGTDASASSSLSSSSYSLFSASSNSGSSTSPTHSGVSTLRVPQPQSITSSGSKITSMLTAAGAHLGGLGSEAAAHDAAAAMDYNARKALASRAMNQEVSPDVPRTPTTCWSGMGFSKSHSAALLSLNRANFGIGYSSSPAAGGDDKDHASKEQTRYCHQATPKPVSVSTLISFEEEEEKTPEAHEKDVRSGSIGCRVSGTSGSLSSIGSIASSQQTLMSPSFADRTSTAEWRSSWSDFETEDCSINESLFLSGKPSIGSYGSPEKKPESALSAGLAGLNLSVAAMDGSKRNVDANNNDSPKKTVCSAAPTSNSEAPCGNVMVARPQTSAQQISFSSSNVIDGVLPLPRPITSAGYNDLYDVLAKLSLSKYIEVFQGQDIDLSTFLTLTESDLARLGISTFGARRKILVAIQELRKQGPIFSGSAAVGAERRPSNF